MSKKYTKQELIDAVKNSCSIRQVLLKLNLKPAGGNYQTIKLKINKFNICTKHFTGQGWSKNKVVGPKRPIEDYLSNKKKLKSHSLRKRLIREGFFENKCYKCQLKLWNNEPIPLELHHIDGNHLNNNLDNLTILCPNCHAQTDNYRGKNAKNKITIIKKLNSNLCLDCNKSIHKKSKRCKSCSSQIIQSFKTKRPPKEQLDNDFKQLKYYTSIAKKYGVSDNAVRKWVKYYK